ncbi:hypothetical protein BC833DRAFT_567957 [Globomyces pollinis-pini]|nr:hypothetical protein BC833DRAFT_567957 [Globomyces pollinis-pini]
MTFKHQVKKETITDKNGTRTVKKRKLKPPPDVTFRERQSITDMTSQKPTRFVPLIPQPFENWSFEPNFIPEWYMEPIRQCLLCHTITAKVLKTIADKFDLCDNCYRKKTPSRFKLHKRIVSTSKNGKPLAKWLAQERFLHKAIVPISGTLNLCS